MDFMRKWLSTKHPLFLFFLVITGGYLVWVGVIFLNSLRAPRVESNSKKKPQLTERKDADAPRFTMPVQERSNPIAQSTGKAKEPVVETYASVARSPPHPAPKLTPTPSSQPESQPQIAVPTQSTPNVVVTEADDGVTEGGFKFKPVPAIVNDKDVTITPDQLLGTYTLFVFYPQNLAKKGDLLEFNKNVSVFKNLNGNLIGCSNDNVFSHENMNRMLGKDGITFPLIGDDTKEMSKLFGVELDNTGRNVPCTVITSPEGSIVKRISSINCATVKSEFEKLVNEAG